MADGYLVVGVDGSPAAGAAAGWAAEEALLRGLALQLLHARPLLPHLLPSGARQPVVALHTMESELTRTHPGLDVHCLEAVDTPAAALIAAGEDAELLVVGARGDGGFPGLLVGSVGLHAATRASCPVVMVRPPAVEGGPPGPVVVLGVDARDPGERAVDFAFGWAERRGARLHAVHAWNPPSAAGSVALSVAERGSWEQPEQELLDEALHGWAKHYPDVPLTAETVPLGPAQALVSAARRARLLVLGRRQAGTPCHPRLGPVAHAVLHHAPAPVAVVPEC